MKSKNEDERKDFMRIDLEQEEKEREDQKLFLDISNDELVKARIDETNDKSHKKTALERQGQTINQEVNVQVGLNSGQARIQARAHSSQKI